jgi:nucleoside-diphosphate-sugar epimerase
MILVTGTTGFIGKHFSEFLLGEGRQVRFAVRDKSRIKTPLVTKHAVEVGEVDSSTSWRGVLRDVKTVVHLAARAHILRENVSDPLAEFRRVNVDGTYHLARQAIDAGVRRFVFISSIGVNGNLSTVPFTEEDSPNPQELYALSKLEAEERLQDLASESSMEITIVRPPLVCGPNAPGNFGNLLHWVSKGTPLPLGAIHNRRSLVMLDNLLDFILTCIDHPAAANQTFLVADGEDISTTELLHRVGVAMGKPARLIPVPMRLLTAGAMILGKKAMAQRLCGSLQIDISKAREVLGWTPPVSLDVGLTRAVGTCKVS